MDTNPSLREQIHKLGQLISDMPVAMLTTVTADGSLRSRPMATQRVPFDGILWFFTDSGSAKGEEIHENHNVNLSYADSERDRYVSVSGAASLIRDEAKVKELWNPVFRAWFPDGPDDPALALLRVEVDRAEYWDAPASRMVQVFGMIKAAVGGRRYEPGEHRRLDLHGQPEEPGHRYEPSQQDWPKGERPPRKDPGPAPWPHPDHRVR